jgi:hypothetical protein
LRVLLLEIVTTNLGEAEMSRRKGPKTRPKKSRLSSAKNVKTN